MTRKLREGIFSKSSEDQTIDHNSFKAAFPAALILETIMMHDIIKCFVPVQKDDVIFSSLTYHFCNPVVEVCQVCLAQFTLAEVLAVINHLWCFPCELAQF